MPIDNSYMHNFLLIVYNNPMTGTLKKYL